MSLLLAGCASKSERAIARLQSPAAEERRRAAEELGALKDARGVDALIAALRDREPEVSGAAARALSEIGDARALPALVACFADERRLKAPATPAPPQSVTIHYLPGGRRIVEGPDLELEQDSVRGVAARAVIRFGPRAVEELLRAIEDTQRAERHEAAYFALGGLREPRAVPILVAALRSGDAHVGAASRALVKIGPPAIEPLYSALPGVADDFSARVFGRTLGSIPPADVERLLAYVKAREKGPRRAAIAALGASGNEKAAPALAAILGDTDVSDDVSEALKALGPAAVPAVLSVLQKPGACVPYFDNCSEYVRSSAAGVLGSVTEPAVFERLLPMLEHPNSEIAEAAATAIGSQATSGSKPAVEFLERKLEEGDLRMVARVSNYYASTVNGQTRADAQVLLAALRQHGNRDLCESLLNTGDEKLRRAAQAWAAEHGYRVESLRLPH
ncbi:MAG TPA: HEAT repeat domain-containing protein [Terriglobales bacterium]|nr:HEAT repeat domain-containing protein [Terriglobales bacterium]